MPPITLLLGVKRSPSPAEERSTPADAADPGGAASGRIFHGRLALQGILQGPRRLRRRYRLALQPRNRPHDQFRGWVHPHPAASVEHLLRLYVLAGPDRPHLPRPPPAAGGATGGSADSR